MATAIFQKHDALKKFNNSKVVDIKLFSEDKNTTGSKKFYVTKPQEIYNRILDDKSSQSHYYEFWSENSNIVYSQDIDIGIHQSDDSNETSKPIVHIREDALKIVRSNILKTIDAAKTYYDFEYDIRDIIVLESEPEISSKESKKYSYHVIYRGLAFQNHSVCKDFHIKANSDQNLYYTDVSIYGNSCLRLCYCCKAGKKAILLPLEMIINGKKTLTDMNSKMDHYQFFLRTMMTVILPSDETMINKSQMFIKPKPEPANVLDKPKNSTDNINIDDILFQLPYDICDDYDTWAKIGVVLYHLDGGNDGYFDLWDTWSQQSSKYKSWEMKKRWNSFSGSKVSIGYLINICKRAGVTNIYKNTKASYTEIIQNFPVREIQIETDNDTIFVNMQKLEPSIFSPHLDKKLLCVQSEKGTGKTYNLLKTLFEIKHAVDEDTTMLFISSRRTFGAKLLGDLKQYGFVLYSDIKGDIFEKKVICQIDSLSRLQIDRYKYVVVDEGESCARYVTSKHFTKNPKANVIVGNMEQRIAEANNVIVMDADLSNRCMEYYKNVMSATQSQTQLIINTFKPYSDYTMVSMTYNDWVQKVLEDITLGKKLAIPMASNNKAKDLKTKIEMDNPETRVLLIHKETKDEDKVASLMNVNETWQNFDIVIYTPSVCMGVSFDPPDYFDNIYAYGCENSLGAQEFCQMLHRVREPRNKTIYVSLNIYKEFDEIEDVLTFEQMENIVCSDYYLTHYDLNQTVLKVKSIRTETNERVLFYPYKDDPNYRLFIHNALEQILNTQNFGASFYGYVKAKEYKLDYFTYSSVDRNTQIKGEMKDIRQGRETIDNELNIQGILDAPDISKDDFIDLLKQRDEFLEPEDIQKINRYKFRSCYKLDNDIDLTFDLVDEFNNKEKMKWYHNLVNIMSTDEQQIYDKLEIMKDNIVKAKWMNSCYMDFTSKNIYSNHLFATNIINHSGFDINNTSRNITQTAMKEHLNSCMAYIDSNKQEIAYKFGLKIYNKSFDNLILKDQMKIVNSVLTNFYGLKIKRISPYKKNMDSDNIIYKLSDNRIWESMPREDKIIPVNLEYTKEYEHINQTEESLINFMNDDDDDV